MALKTTVNWANAKTVSRSKELLEQRVGSKTYYNLRQYQETIILELNAVTEAACNTAIDANAQPADPGGGAKQTYSYSMSRESDAIGSYTITRTDTYKSLTLS